MKALKERILAEGENLGEGILKVDTILNQQLDPALMFEIGKEFASIFRNLSIHRILTAEASGIAPALMAGMQLGVPVTYARKKRPATMTGTVYSTTAPSHTKGGEVELFVSAEFLKSGENILVIDDFLATGESFKALAQLVSSAKANLVAAGFIIEKEFQGGRKAVKAAGLKVAIHALATVVRMDGNTIELA